MEALASTLTWPVGTVSAAVLTGDRTGPPGLAGTVGPLGRRFPWASVTKLCTALAALVAIEERTVSLDDPAGPPGSTVAHLLAHASGLGPLGEVLAEPGRRRIYSNAGFDVVAEVVAARAEMPFARYLTEAVLEPLGMTGAGLAADASPAAGMYGTVLDLVALGRELLAPRVVDPATLERATSVAFPGVSGVLPGFGRQDPCDWGLGFEIKGTKSPHWTGSANSPATFGHFGQSGGFLWVDPEADVACCVLTDRLFGPWAARAWPRLADDVLAETSPVGRRRAG